MSTLSNQNEIKYVYIYLYIQYTNHNMNIFNDIPTYYIYKDPRSVLFIKIIKIQSVRRREYVDILIHFIQGRN